MVWQLTSLAWYEAWQQVVGSLKRAICSMLFFGIALLILRFVLGKPGQAGEEMNWGVTVVATAAIMLALVFIWNLAVVIWKAYIQHIPITEQWQNLEERASARREERLEKRAQALHGINPILYEMEQCLLELVTREQEKPFDFKGWERVNEELNTGMLGLSSSKAKTIRGVQRVASKREAIMAEKYGAVSTRQEGVQIMVEIGTFLDGKGFGLKNQRQKDRRYRRLCKKLDKIRVLPTVGTKLGNLIHEHYVFAEAAANILLNTSRDLRIRAIVNGSQYSITDFMSPIVRANTEGLERNIREILAKIRADISDCIRKMGEGKDDE